MTGAAMFLLGVGRMPGWWLRRMARLSRWVWDLARVSRWAPELAAARIPLSGDPLFGETLGIVANLAAAPRVGAQRPARRSVTSLPSTPSRKGRASFGAHTPVFAPPQTNVSYQAADRPSLSPRSVDESRQSRLSRHRADRSSSYRRAVDAGQLGRQVDAGRLAAWAEEPRAKKPWTPVTVFASPSGDSQGGGESPPPREAFLPRPLPGTAGAEDPSNSLTPRARGSGWGATPLALERPLSSSISGKGRAGDAMAAAGRVLLDRLVRRAASGLERAGIHRPDQPYFLAQEWSQPIDGAPAPSSLLSFWNDRLPPGSGGSDVAGVEPAEVAQAGGSVPLPTPTTPHPLSGARSASKPMILPTSEAPPLPATEAPVSGSGSAERTAVSAPPGTAGSPPLFSLQRLIRQSTVPELPAGTTARVSPVAVPVSTADDDLETLAASIKRILDEEARRHGIDV